MLEFDFPALAALGLTPALAARALALEVPLDDSGEATLALARVIEVNRETMRIADGREERSARMSPRLAGALAADGDAVAVGDWVVASIDRHRQCWVSARVPCVNRISRRDADGRSHAVVSNVDIALLVMGLDDDFNARRLERYLALVHDDAIVPVVVLTKRDIAAPTPELLEARLAALRGRLAHELEVVAVDATHPDAAEALRPQLRPGLTLVLLGSSGAGKSTLTNTLLGAAVQDTGPVREHDGRGKHTTTSRSLHRLPGGACIIDTPGLRTLRPDSGESAVAAAFGDVQALAPHCRFRDCAHQHEPGCAVREALDADRLRNYHKLLREQRRDTLTPLDRRRQLGEWKARSRAAKAHVRAKRGEG